ncbi:MAG: metallophosphoesterase [Candidatus Rifleibacteriota bacterium]
MKPFTALFHLLYLLVNAYTCACLLRMLPDRRVVKYVVITAFVLFSPLLLLSKIPALNSIAGTLIFMGTNWMGFVLTVLTVSIANMFLKLIFKNFIKELNLTALAALLLIMLYSFFNASRLPEVKTIEIRSAKIPAGSADFCVAMLSDIHLRPFVSKRRIAETVRLVNELDPDLILITGDLVDSQEEIEDFKKILATLRAKHGIFSVTGNHEQYPGIPVYLDLLKSFNAIDLDDSGREVNSFINVVGISDDSQATFSRENESIKKLIEFIRPDKFNILLSHRPDNFEFFAENGIDLQLSGHTHAGQFFPLELMVGMFFRHSHGLGSHGNSRIYTSAGTGHFGPAMRFLSRNEITRIILKPD